MKKFLFITILIAVAGLALYFGLQVKDGANISDIEEPVSGEPEPGQEFVPSEPDEVFTEPVTYSTLNNTYSHARFSFKYSDGFNVFSSLVEGGEVVTIENSRGSGFQIFSIAWDEPGPITPERIWQDMPDADVIDPKNAVLDGVKTLVFYGYDGDLGETFEAWAVSKGRLYQIMGPKTAEKLVTETLETWSWR